MKWIFEKFYGDGAIYTICPNCGFYHCVSEFKDRETFEIVINTDYIYKFCPMCGKKDTTNYDGDNIDVIWNKRSIFDEEFKESEIDDGKE